MTGILKKNSSRILLLFIAATGLLYFCALNSELDLGGDSANYILLAKAMMQGKGYTDIYLPIAQPHTLYPPVFPLLLSFVMLFTGANVFALKFIPLFAMCGAVYVFARLLQDYNKKRNLGSIMLFAVNPVIFYSAVTLMSEAVYLLFSFLSLLMLGKYAKKAAPLNKYLWLTVLFMLLSFYTRTIGLILFPAAALFLLYKRNFKKVLLVSSLFMIGISAWMIRGMLCGSGYLAFLLADHSGGGVAEISKGSVFLSRCIHNLVIYAGKIPADTFFYPYFYNIGKGHPVFVIKAVLSIILFGLISYGFWARVKKEIKPVDLYVPLVLMACVCWPVHGPRFIVPIFGFLIFYFVSAVKTITKARKKQAGFIIFIMLGLALFADLAHINKAKNTPYEPDEMNYLDALAWLKVNSPADSIIMCRIPRVAFLMADRRAMYYPGIADPEKIMTIMKENRIDYVLLDTLGKKDAQYGMCIAEKFIAPVIRKYPEKFLGVYSAGKPDASFVYKVIE